MTRTRVLLVDDHEVVRLGLMTLIDDQDDLEVVGEAGTATDAVRQVERLRPDVVLMDIRIPGEGGIEATRQITESFPDTQVVMLTSYADDELVFQAIRAGAAGYVLKQIGNEELLRAIRAAAKGEALLDSSTTARLLDRVRDLERRADNDAFKDLSAREMDVLAEVSRGLSNAEIGAILHLSEKTIRNYVSTILGKLNLTNRVELATYAVKHHLGNRRRHE
jgi:two-component system response regulator DevR